MASLVGRVLSPVLAVPAYFFPGLQPADNPGSEPLLGGKEEEAQEEDVEARPVQPGSGPREEGELAAAPEAPSAAASQAEPLLANGSSHAAGPATPLAKRVDHSAFGLALYALSSCFLATCLCAAKLLGQWGVPVLEVLGARSAFLLAFSLAGCAWGGKNPLGHRRGLLLVRGVFGFGAIGNYLWAVTLLPLNDTLVLTFTAPIWAALLAPILIKEKPPSVLWIAIVICTAGVTLVVQPPFLGFQHAGGTFSALGAGVALAQALCSALAKTCVRELRRESPSVSVFYLAWVSMVVAVLGCTLPVKLGYAPEDVFKYPANWQEWALLCAVGLTSYGSQICMTNSLRYCKAAPALAMSYLSIVVTLIYGYFIFDETPTVLKLLGACLIIVSTAWLGIFVKRHPDPNVSTLDIKGLQRAR